MPSLVPSGDRLGSLIAYCETWICRGVPDPSALTTQKWRLMTSLVLTGSLVLTTSCSWFGRHVADATSRSNGRSVAV